MQKGDAQIGNYNPSTLQMGNGKFLNDWLTDRHIESIASGLWFGGENGWELLTNDNDAINYAIKAKINELDVEGYEQATIDTTNTESVKSSTLTIKGIQEADGKISHLNTKDISIAIDGVYHKDNNKIATQTTVTNAINALDVNTVQAVTFNTSADNGNTTLTFKGIKEVDGKIAQGDEQTPDTFIVGDAKLKIQIGSAAASDVFSANAQSDSTIKLDGNVFKKEGDVFSIYTTEGVSSTNPLVTQKDIDSLAGAMHYKGAITSDEQTPNNWPTKVEAGDVYIATNKFEKDGNVIESGDLIVFNSESLTDYKVIQSNLTLGTGVGQVATNDRKLEANNIVVATSTGIKTIGITEDNLTREDNNTRTLSIANGTADTLVASLYHDVTISDTFKVIGKDFNQSINISSTNRSIEIAANASENATGVVVDLVWNTSIE